MRAEPRFANFLVNLASRYKARGYSSTSFQLRMARKDIGNFLGLSIESLSGIISRFKQQGLSKVSNREMEVLVWPPQKRWQWEARLRLKRMAQARRN